MFGCGKLFHQHIRRRQKASKTKINQAPLMQPFRPQPSFGQAYQVLWPRCYKAYPFWLHSTWFPRNRACRHCWKHRWRRSSTGRWRQSQCHRKLRRSSTEYRLRYPLQPMDTKQGSQTLNFTSVRLTINKLNGSSRELIGKKSHGSYGITTYLVVDVAAVPLAYAFHHGLYLNHHANRSLQEVGS